MSTPAMGASTFLHDDWTTVKQAIVDERGFVDYRTLVADRALFDRYIADLMARSPDSHPAFFADRDAELAYWLNAYNAMTIYSVLDKGIDIDSVWGWTGTGVVFFAVRKITLGGKQMTLKSLEDNIIRARYGDARIHAAINCASFSCPPLPQEAFVAERLDEQLDGMVRRWIGLNEHLQVDAQRKVVKLNKIFQWFKEDFVAEKPSLIEWVNQFRDEPIPTSYKVEFLPYDKGLNRQQ
ncbi:MAG: DUF547 domain-containing protein [Acidobacteriota bacterium]